MIYSWKRIVAYFVLGLANILLIDYAPPAISHWIVIFDVSGFWWNLCHPADKVVRKLPRD